MIHAVIRPARSPILGLKIGSGFARLRGFAATGRRWWVRHRQRENLAELSDYLLRDIGFTRDEVLRESAKSFWQR